MPTGPRKPKNVAQYIAGFPKDVQRALQAVRRTIQRTAPEAQETISYGIPAFMLNDTYLVYFAGYEKHVSVYPVPAGTTAFNRSVAAYRAGKGTLRFPLERQIPYSLLQRIVRALIRSNTARAKVKRKLQRP
jgi:uncharacterized protein YdhG (YjbR/CyaY superfamily)